jgi:ankyrin repeat protein
VTNEEQQMVKACREEPALIFNLIKRGCFKGVEKLIDENKVDVNLTDCVGNDVLMRLLKAHQYTLVVKLMKKRNWDVNHQNEEGNTFGHILAQDNSVGALKVVDALKKKTKYMPNIKNNRGETALDKAINNNYLMTMVKILEDKRFDDIDIISFKNLYKVCIKSSYYGKYTKLNNLEIIVGNLNKKELNPTMRLVVDEIINNYEIIKDEILNNKTFIMDTIVNG